MRRDVNLLLGQTERAARGENADLLSAIRLIRLQLDTA